MEVSESTPSNSGAVVASKYIRKKNLCYYCGNKFVKVGEHMARVHKDEPEMKKILGMKNESLSERKEVRRHYSILVGKAHQRYNTKMLLTGNPDGFIVKYRRKDLPVSRRVPCSYCGHMYSRSKFRVHACVSSDGGRIPGDHPRPVAHALRTFRGQIMEIPKNLTSLLGSLIDDEVSGIVLSDATILGFGEKRMKSLLATRMKHLEAWDAVYGNKCDYLRSKLRTLATYVKHFRAQMGKTTLFLKDTFLPLQMDNLLDVAQAFSTNFQHPNALLKLKKTLGHVIKYIVHRVKPEEYPYWEMLRSNFNHEWTTMVNEATNTGLRVHHIQRNLVMPTADELNRFNKYVNDNLDEMLEKEITTYRQYRRLCRFALVRITTFNFRRSGEVAQMMVAWYKNRGKATADNANQVNTNMVEKIVADFTESVVLKGKSEITETVLALLLPNCIAAIEKILQVRGAFGLEKNIFIFAIASKLPRDQHLGGYKAIVETVREVLPGKEKVITASVLRKYISTQMLWLNISQREKLLLMSQLGHQADTHDNVYLEHMATGHGRYHAIPALLLAIEAGLQVKKPEEMTDLDVVDYIRRCITKEKGTTDVDKENHQNILDDVNYAEAGTGEEEDLVPQSRHRKAYRRIIIEDSEDSTDEMLPGTKMPPPMPLRTEPPPRHTEPPPPPLHTETPPRHTEMYYEGELASEEAIFINGSQTIDGNEKNIDDLEDKQVSKGPIVIDGRDSTQGSIAHDCTEHIHPDANDPQTPHRYTSHSTRVSVLGQTIYGNEKNTDDLEDELVSKGPIVIDGSDSTQGSIAHDCTEHIHPAANDPQTPHRCEETVVISEDGSDSTPESVASHSGLISSDSTSEAGSPIDPDVSNIVETASTSTAFTAKNKVAKPKKRKPPSPPSVQLRKGGTHWSDKMLCITGEVFKLELENKSLPITAEKVRICIHRFKTECDREISVSGMKAQMYNIRKGIRSFNISKK